MNAKAAFESLGALPLAGNRVRFRVWAPHARNVSVVLGCDHSGKTMNAVAPMRTAGDGYFEVTLDDVRPGATYLYDLDGTRRRPDPASRFQPFGVHQPSQVVSREFPWSDERWRGIPWTDYVLYEIHVGTYTRGGTLDAITEHLDRLTRLGVTAVQLMSVAQFPGERNWGYDGVHLFAVQHSYGGPLALKRLVDACHARGLAVVLDVVYNHLGPEGNYLQEFGPYFTDRYQTLWGSAVNFDGPNSAAVRQFFIANALYWLDEFHIDGLRLDATHAMRDHGEQHFLAELTATVDDWRVATRRMAYLFAEDSSDDPRLVTARNDGGYGLDAQYLDDFQRSLVPLLTGEQAGFYGDFGPLTDFAKACRDGFVLTGQHSAYRGRPWGASSAHLPADRFVAMAQTHDTVGNHPAGQRLGRLVDFAGLKLAAAAAILSPTIPLLFMGEEYDEPAPFYYFTSHGDPELADAVRQGRIAGMDHFGWRQPLSPPDPQALQTFLDCKLHHDLAGLGHHAVLWSYYQELLRLRRALPALRQPARDRQRVTPYEDQQVLVIERHDDDQVLALCFNFANDIRDVANCWPHDGNWQLLFDSDSAVWSGSVNRTGSFWDGSHSLFLAPRSALLLLRKLGGTA